MTDIYDLASRCGMQTYGNKNSYNVTADQGSFEQFCAEHRKAVLEEAAVHILAYWRALSNEVTGSAITSYQQNGESHGIVAAAREIRQLKDKP